MVSAPWLVIAGQWLFQRRSYMPLFFAILFVPAFDYFEFVQSRHSMQLRWELLCLGISLLGLTVRILTVAYITENSSGRQLSAPSADQLNTTGLYSLVRHPLYLGNSIIWLGVASMLHLWWLSLAFIIISISYHRLIICAEEDYLNTKFGQDFQEWSAKTPAFIPAFRRWAPPHLPFSAIMVIRREYPGLFQIIIVFSILNTVLHHVARGAWVLDPFFLYLLITACFFCGTIFCLIRWSSYLQAPQRNMPSSGTATRSTENLTGQQ